MRFVLALVLLVSFGCSKSQHASLDARPRELPITKVVLYQNGVGYFERRGELDGDVLTLQVRPDQINDILKSLTVLDLHKGRAVSVSLPLEKRGADVLAELPAQVRDATGLQHVLAAFRGARVAVDGKEGKREGRIVGVEPLSADPSAPYRLTLKTDDGKLVVYPLDAIEEVALGDRTLVVGLDRSLDVSLDAGDWKPVVLSVRLAGSRNHELLVSYIAEMPVWKPTYRIVLGDAEQALVQGWAVVDNVSGDDWNDARLSLVAGNPVSFRYDLHSPQFTTRVDMTPAHRSVAMAPVIERAGFGAAPPSLSAAPSPLGESARSRSAGPSAKSARVSQDEDRASISADNAAEDSYDRAELMSAQAGSMAQGQTVGALFRYDLNDPVTVPDGTSNLVSIVNAKVAAQDVVLARPDEGSVVLRAVKLTNATGATLERGPVAIYDDSTFMGEAFVDRMEPDATAFLTYAQDGTVSVTQYVTSEDEGGTLLRISGGFIETQVTAVYRRTLTIKNDAKQDLTTYVKFPLMPGYTMRDKPKNTVDTNEAVFVPVPVAARKTTTKEVVWTQPAVRTIGLDTDLSRSVLKLYLGSGKVPPEMAPTLKEIVRLKEKRYENDVETARLTSLKAQLDGDEARLRANIDTLRRTSGNGELLTTLARKLGEIDAKIGTMSATIVKLSEENADIDRKMTQLIKGVTLEAT